MERNECGPLYPMEVLLLQVCGFLRSLNGERLALRCRLRVGSCCNFVLGSGMNARLRKERANRAETGTEC